MIDIVETIESIYKFSKLNNHEKEFVFFSENRNYTEVFKPIIKKFLQNNVNIIYITSDKKDFYYTHKDKNLKSFYISKTIGQIILLNNISCKNLILTMPDLDNYHIKKSKNCLNYVYLFHSAVSTNMIYRDKAFFSYDKIFCVGEHHYKELSEYIDIKKLKNLKLVKAGYPKFDQLYSQFNKCENEFILNKITIAPSWGKKNIFNENIIEALQVLLDENYKINLRPHSQSFKYDKKILKKIEDKFSDNSNFKLERGNFDFKNVFESEFLITDWSGIAIEYAFITNRPILYVNTPKKINNKFFNDISIEPLEVKIREKIGLIIEEQNILEIGSYVKKLKKNEYLKNEIINFKKDFLYNFQKSDDFIYNKITKDC